jgi:hypothetical protein
MAGERMTASHLIIVSSPTGSKEWPEWGMSRPRLRLFNHLVGAGVYGSGIARAFDKARAFHLPASFLVNATRAATQQTRKEAKLIPPTGSSPLAGLSSRNLR